jgi:RNA polymerase sigma factor (sigma-70 family)
MSTGEAEQVNDSYEAFFAAQVLPAVRLAYLLVGRREVAEEVAQEALTAVYLRWTDLESPGAYLRTTVVNRSRSYQRRVILERRSARGAPAPVQPEAADRAIWEDVRRLRPRDREVLVLRFYEDLTIEQVATALGIPANTVKTRLRRAVERLRRSMS